MQYDKYDKSVTESIDTVALSVVKYLRKYNLKISTAESLTGGMISEAITSVDGASNVFEMGVCSYSNRIKRKILNVKKSTLENFTEISAQTAEEMSRGIMKLSGSDISIATTGIAGPTGGTKENPIGTVYISVRLKDKIITKNLALYNSIKNLDRDLIRLLTTKEALEIALELLSGYRIEVV